MREPSTPSTLLAQLISSRPGRPVSQQEVLGELRRVILSGAAPPGTSIPLEAVAHFFVVSPIPVRESLKTLVGEGLVDHEPRGGYRVARLTREEMREFYVIREVLEGAAIRAAVGRASSEDDEAARRIHESLGEAISQHDFREYHRQSRRFHFALLEPSRMYRLLHIFELAWNVTEPAQPMAMISDEDRAQMHADHAAMLAAFVNRDADELVRCSREHYQRLERAVGNT